MTFDPYLSHVVMKCAHDGQVSALGVSIVAIVSVNETQEWVVDLATSLFYHRLEEVPNRRIKGSKAP